MRPNHLLNQDKNTRPYAIITNNGVSIPVLIRRGNYERPYEMVKLVKTKSYTHLDLPNPFEFERMITERIEDERKGIHRAEFTSDFINFYEIVSTQIFFPTPQNPENIKFLTLEEMAKFLKK
jgi:hypothetical protein